MGQSRTARELDRRIQKPDRLDPVEHGLSATNPGTYTRSCYGLQRIAELQNGEQPADTRSVDADVCGSQPKFCTAGLCTVHEKDDEEGGSRFKDFANRARLVDCIEEFVKYTIVMRGHFALFSDRFSERKPMEDDGSVNGVKLLQT